MYMRRMYMKKRKSSMDTIKTWGTAIGIGLFAVGTAAYMAMSFLADEDGCKCLEKYMKKNKKSGRDKNEDGCCCNEEGKSYSYKVYGQNNDECCEHGECCDDIGCYDNIQCYDDQCDDGCCCLDDSDEYLSGNRYSETLFHRRDRVNKKQPKGIEGEKSIRI